MHIIFGLSAHFLAAKTSPPYMHTSRRKKRSFTGNSARTSAHFSAMFFRKTRLLSRRCICIPQGARNEVFGKLSPNLKSFFGDVFSQDKENKRRRTSVFQAKFDTVFGKLSPNLKSFFGDVFSQDKENKRRRTSVFQAKFDTVFGKLSPNLKSFFGGVFSQDKENKRRRTVGTPSEI